jgi:hypothetical protein
MTDLFGAREIRAILGFFFWTQTFARIASAQEPVRNLSRKTVEES